MFKSLEKIQGKLDFKRKDVREPERPDERWDGDIYHIFGSYQDIEWLKIRAQISIRTGALLEPKIEDHTDELVRLIRKAGIPFSRTESVIKIWGYVRLGASPNWE